MNPMKCREIHNQNMVYKKLGLNADSQIKMTMNNTKKPVQKFRYKITRILAAGLQLILLIQVVGIHLHLIQFWLLNLESIENTAIQQNTCLHTFAQHRKTRLRKTTRVLTYRSRLCQRFKKRKGRNFTKITQKLTKIQFQRR